MLPFPIISQTTNNAPSMELKKLSMGNNHWAVLYSNGELYTAGTGTSYQLGTGTNVNNPLWSLVNTDVAMVWAGSSCTLVAKNDGTWWHVGSKFSVYGTSGTNQTWTDVSSTFSSVSLINIKKLELGASSMFILMNDGTLYGMGYNQYGELGKGNSTAVTSLSTIASSVQDVSCRVNHCLYISGTLLYRCGLNTSAQLGDNTQTNKNTFTSYTQNNYTPIQVYACTSASYVVYQHNTTFAKALFSTGSAYYGETGRGIVSSSPYVYGTFGMMTNGSNAAGSTVELPYEGTANNMIVLKNNNTLMGMGYQNFYACAATDNNRVNNIIVCSPPVVCNQIPGTNVQDITNICTDSTSQLSLLVYQNKVYWAGNGTKVGLSGSRNYWSILSTPYS